MSEKEKIIGVSIVLTPITIFLIFVSFWLYELQYMKNTYSDSKYLIKEGSTLIWGTSEYKRDGDCVSYIDDDTRKKVEKCSEILGIYEN